MKLILLLLGAATVLAMDVPISARLAQDREIYKSKIQANVAAPAVNSVWDQCNDIQFNHAQVGFNEMCGIDPGVTWRQADALSYKINQLMNDTTGMNTACTARQMFSATLGVTYPLCVNRYYLLSKGNTDFTNVITYVRIYKQLEFTCSVAFEDYELNLPCILKAQKSKAYNNCLSNFHDANTANPNMLCPNSNDMITCVQNVVTTTCNIPTGWILCERERVAYAYDCPNLRCNVPSN